jgi:hypothetical protein
MSDLLIFFIVIILSNFQYGPGYNTPISVILEGDRFTVTAVNNPDQGYELTIKNNDDDSSYIFDSEKKQLETRISRIESLCKISRWLVAIGSIGSAAEIIQILELNNDHTNYFYKGFHSSLSRKSGRVVFQRYHPRYTSLELCSPIIELVSVKENPAEKKTIFPVPPWKVYDEKGYVHAPVSPLAWSPDGNRLAFVDKHGIYGDWKGENTLYWVLIDFSENPAGKITVTPIDVSSYKFPGMGLERKAFSLPELYWQDEDSLCGDMGSDDRYWRSRKVEISPEGKYLGPCDDNF